MTAYVNDYKLNERVTQADLPVAIAFLAHESIPCKHYAPEYKAAAAEFDGRVEFYMISVDENPAITEELLGVDGIPTTLVFHDGSEVARYSGPYSREALCERITALLNRKQP